MNIFIKKNISIIVALFILIGPLLDLITGLSIHTFKVSITIGIIIRILFLVSICFIVLFTFKKKNVLIPYLLIGLYFIMYILGIILYKDSSVLFSEIQGLLKVFYFPILFVSIYMIRKEIHISNMTLFTTLFLYLIFIFVPLLLGIGYDTYDVTKEGTLGFYNSANEISGIISILTPIMFTILVSSKRKLLKILLIIMYLVVILMMGTKTPLLSLIITLGLSVIYLWIKSIKDKKYKNIFISTGLMFVGVVGLVLIVPQTTFYKNIETHLRFLKVKNVTDVLEDDRLVDHFIFSQRLTFLHDRALDYKESNIYQKIFGIGYTKDNSEAKLIEMDYFDIYYNHGIIGFLIFFIITLYILYKILEKGEKLYYKRFMYDTSLLLIIVLSLFTGHIITAPAVSILVLVITISLSDKSTKKVLLSVSSTDREGQKSLLRLTENINTKKFDVTVIYDNKKKHSIKNTTIKEFLLPKKNYLKLLIYKIFNYDNYDFSLNFSLASPTSHEITIISSTNNNYYIRNKEEILISGYKRINEYHCLIISSKKLKEEIINNYGPITSKNYIGNNLILEKIVND